MCIEIELGALARPLSEQIPAGAIPENIIALLQKDDAAISRLLVRGYIPSHAATKARQKIINAVKKQLTSQ